MSNKRIIIHSKALDANGYPHACPFNTQRAGRTVSVVESMGLLDPEDRAIVAPVALTRSEMEWFHDSRYLDVLAGSGDNNNVTEEAAAMGLGSPDCPVFPGMFDYISLACGATVTGTRKILSGDAFIAFNPSGGFHHAHRGRAAGFCYMNDVVLAAMLLADAGRRVAFVDIDVHHCDGVQEAFWSRNDVLVMSMHESGKTLFPGTGFPDEIGAGDGVGYTINLPLPVGTYDAVYKDAFHRGIMPVLKKYNPDVIMIELGMDGLAGDPLAHLHLTNNVYADLLRDMVGLGKPVLAVGGGGYDVPNTVRGWALMWSVMCGEGDYDLSAGMGGVMMQNMDWAGGLRDRALLTDAGQRGSVKAEIDAAIHVLQEKVFPVHGI